MTISHSVFSYLWVVYDHSNYTHRQKRIDSDHYQANKDWTRQQEDRFGNTDLKRPKPVHDDKTLLLVNILL